MSSRVRSYFARWFDPYRRPEPHELVVILALLIAVSTVPLVFGLARMPNSLEDAPQGFGRFTAGMMMAGAVGVAIGEFRMFGLSDSLEGQRKYDKALLFKQFMLFPLGGGAALYWLAVGFANGWTSNAWIAQGLSIGLALGCLVRFIRIRRYVRGRKAAGEGAG